MEKREENIHVDTGALRVKRQSQHFLDQQMQSRV